MVLSFSTRAGDACADANTEVDGSARDGLRVPKVRDASEVVAMPEAALLDRRMCGCESTRLAPWVRAEADRVEPRGPLLAAALGANALVLLERAN